MLMEGDNYAPSMVKFLNQFSRKSRANSGDKKRKIAALTWLFTRLPLPLPVAMHTWSIGRFTANCPQELSQIWKRTANFNVLC